MSNFQTLFEGSLLGTVRCLLSSQQNAFQLAFLARLTPIPFGIQNSLFALSPISTRDYLQASVVGMFPCQAINVYLGSTVRSMEEVRTTGCPNKFGISSEMIASEASIVYKKVCISLQKIAFLAFFENC